MKSFLLFGGNKKFKKLHITWLHRRQRKPAKQREWRKPKSAKTTTISEREEWSQRRFGKRERLHRLEIRRQLRRRRCRRRWGASGTWGSGRDVHLWSKRFRFGWGWRESCRHSCTRLGLWCCSSWNWMASLESLSLRLVGTRTLFCNQKYD